MESWGLAVDNPYYVLTTDGGTFTLTDVPPGDYTPMAWHPGLGTMLQKKVTVTEKGCPRLISRLRLRKGGVASMRLSIIPLRTESRLGSFVDIRPTLERQVP